MKKILLILTAFLIMATPSFAKTLNLNQILEATTRIGTAGSYGSGTVVGLRNGEYWVLTSAHVVGTYKTATVEFFSLGGKTLPIRGDVKWRAYRKKSVIDFAFITVSEKSLGSWKPRIIPLVPKDFDIRRNTYVQSAGCPKGYWPTAWEGMIMKDEGSRLLFTPPPQGGQSGSGLFVNIPDSNGEPHTRVAGLVTWRIGSTHHINKWGYNYDAGGAIPIHRLHDAMAGKSGPTTVVPDNYKTIGTANKIPRPISELALGTDGKYYDVVIEGSNIEAVNLPLGIQIIRWPNRGLTEVRSPANPLVPSIYDSGYGGGGYSLGPNSYQDEYGGGLGLGDGEVDRLKNKVAELETQISILREERTILRQEKDTFERELLTLRGTEDRARELEVIIKEREVRIEKLTSVLQEKETYIENIDKDIDSLSDKVEETESEVEEVAQERNILGTLAGIGVLSFAGWLIWSKWGGRNKLGDTLDGVEDAVQEKIEPIVGEERAEKIREVVDRLEEKIGDKISDRLEDGSTLDEKLEIILEYLKSIIERITLNREPPGSQTTQGEHPFNHPDFRRPPPGPILSTGRRGCRRFATSSKKKVEPFERVVGLGPVVPGYPANRYSAHEVFDAIQKLSRVDSRFGNITQKITEILEAPRLPRIS